MKLNLKCDRCGKAGTAAEIITDFDDRDLCASCETIENLQAMKDNYARKLAWLESTHLKKLRELKTRIDEIEASLANF